MRYYYTWTDHYRDPGNIEACGTLVYLTLEDERGGQEACHSLTAARARKIAKALKKAAKAAEAAGG